MIYSSTENLIIRDLTPEDIPELVAGERAQGWNATPDKYEARLRDRAAGKCIALAAVYEGHAVGYINVYPDAKAGPLGGRGYPEIVDFGVLEKCRRRGIGTCLMDCAEEIAFGYADTIFLEVGLHSGYGSAQRMYVKRGYLPDGSGVWWQDKPCEPYAPCCNDDDLVLHLTKKKTS